MEERISNLERRLAAVERRLTALEGSPAVVSPDEEIDAEPDLGEGLLTKASTLIGRVLLIFGGAYLLRAITDFGIVPTGFGIFLGAAYALLWLFMAYRKGAQESEFATALFYGGASVLLALPLLAEACGRFALLSGTQGMIALAIFSTLVLATAATRDLRILGWMITLGAIITAFAILRISRAPVAASVFLIILGAMTLWTCYLRRWNGPQWLGALGAFAGLLTLTLLSTTDQWTVSSNSAFMLGIGMLLVYLASFAVHTHLRGNDVGFFEPVQSLLALAAVILAASVAIRDGQIVIPPYGLMTVVLAGGCYAMAFSPRTRTDRGRNFYFYSTLGLVLLVVGSAVLLSPAIAAAAWALLALTMAWFSGRYHRVSLSLQCTFLLLAAGVSSGILGTGLVALAGGETTSWPPLIPWHVIIALTTVACLFIPVAQQSERWGKLAGLPQLIVLALSVWEVGGLFVVVTAPLLVDFSAAEPSRAVLAALRTTVLAAASVTLALSSRMPRWPEARWLVYPVLILVGIKLFVEDFPHGQPVTLFIALALVGSALILVARLLPSRSTTD